MSSAPLHLPYSAPLRYAPLHLCTTSLCTTSAPPLHHLCTCTLHKNHLQNNLGTFSAPQYLHISTSAPAPMQHLCTYSRPVQSSLLNLTSTYTSNPPYLHLSTLHLCTTAPLHLHICTSSAPAQSPLLTLSTYSAPSYQHLVVCTLSTTSAPLHLCTTASALHLNNQLC